MSKIERKVLNSQQNDKKLNRKNTLLLVFRHLWQALIAHLLKRKELEISLSVDDAGNLWWHAYDPVTKRHITRESQAELLQAIDRWSV